MRVRELRLLLKMLPDDMLVHVASNLASHIDVAERAPAGCYRWTDARANPSSLLLRGRTPWFDPEPDFEIHGRWPLAKLTPAERAEVLGEEALS